MSTVVFATISWMVLLSTVAVVGVAVVVAVVAVAVVVVVAVVAVAVAVAVAIVAVAIVAVVVVVVGGGGPSCFYSWVAKPLPTQLNFTAETVMVHTHRVLADSIALTYDVHGRKEGMVEPLLALWCDATFVDPRLSCLCAVSPVRALVSSWHMLEVAS